MGLISWSLQTSCPIQISSIERATLECLHQAPRNISLAECYQNLECLMFQHLVDVHRWQHLLEQCRSYKVKKLLLSFAEHQEVDWFDDLNISQISLGQGIHATHLFEGGQLDKKYRVMIPKSVLALDGY